MLQKLLEWDRALFLFLNDMNMHTFDPVMLVLSSYTLFMLVCLAIAFFILKREGRPGFVTLLFFMLTVGCNNMINQITKRIIARPRPIHEDIFADIIHAIGKHETGFSFYSGHSTTAFCIAIFSLLYFRNKIYSAVILVWAFGVAYSRIYMGKHYPLDVLCGILIGSLIGFVGFKLCEYYKNKKLQPES